MNVENKIWILKIWRLGEGVEWEYDMGIQDDEE